MTEKKPKPKPADKPIKILPITAEDLRDPQKFSAWVFSHGPLILQELFNQIPKSSPNESLKVLADLYKTTLTYRPYTPIEAPKTGNDPAAELAALLAAVPEEEEK